MIRRCRMVAIALGLVILAWQGGNAAFGRFRHPFLVPDLIVAAGLIGAGVLRGDRRARAALIAAFVATGGVFLIATGAAIGRDGFSAGRVAALAGLAPCVACVWALLRDRPR